VIEIIAYQPRWVDEFQAAAARLRAVLGARALRIDHIGSTSVPGLGAKDVVDIQVTVGGPFEPVLETLAAAGYLKCRTWSDHRPPGDEQPEAEWLKAYAREPEGTRRTHIHIRQAGRANQRYALLFRDFLRADALAAGAYERAKRALARLHPDDIDAYLEVKDPVCDLIMAGAEIWAARGTWAIGSSDA
jgi:GrpB-like predicted nucleotidyltransferase (UPF0157 family)